MQTALLRVISLELKSSDPESQSKQILDLFLVVPGSNSKLHLNSQLRITNRNSLEIIISVSAIRFTQRLPKKEVHTKSLSVNHIFKPCV